MSHLGRVAIVSAAFAAMSLAAVAADRPSLPAGEIKAFCDYYGPGTSTAYFFRKDGSALKGEADCNAVRFTLSQVLPPLPDDDGAPGNG